MFMIFQIFWRQQIWKPEKKEPKFRRRKKLKTNWTSLNDGSHIGLKDLLYGPDPKLFFLPLYWGKWHLKINKSRGYLLGF